MDTVQILDETSAAFHPCWACKGPVGADELFCHTCASVQPPGQKDHFARLGVDVGYDVDAAALERTYFALQRKLHPDRFATRGPQEKAISQQQAISLNEAYETLRDPLRRADYLVHIRGRDVLPEGCNLVNDQALLIEAMEMRETLAMAETAADVLSVSAQAHGDIDDCIAALSVAFGNGDLEGACQLTTRLKYLRKLLDEAKAAGARFMSI